MENSNLVKVSQELVKARINKHSSLTEKQLLYYAIFTWSKTKNTVVEYTRADFEKMFNREFRIVEDIETVLKSLSLLQYEIVDYNSERLKFTNMFQDIEYDKGNLIFDFSLKIIPILEEVKRHFLILDFRTLANFKSSYSITLYEKIKTEWAKNKIQMSRGDIEDLFQIGNKKSYANFSNVKIKILDVACKEITQHTEYSVNYTEEKKGRKVTGITIFFEKEKETVEECHFKDREHITLQCTKCNKLQGCIKPLLPDLQEQLVRDNSTPEIQKLYDSLSVINKDTIDKLKKNNEQKREEQEQQNTKAKEDLLAKLDKIEKKKRA